MVCISLFTNCHTAGLGLTGLQTVPSGLGLTGLQTVPSGLGLTGLQTVPSGVLCNRPQEVNNVHMQSCMKEGVRLSVCLSVCLSVRP